VIPVIVTSVGSELAFAVIKALKLMARSRPVSLVGCDMYADVVGTHWCDVFAQVPPARDEPAYLEAVEVLITANGAQALIPTSEAEIALLATHRQRLLDCYGCHVLVNDADDIARFSDKWLAYQWFTANGIASPRTWLGDSLGDLEREFGPEDFPLVLKPRTGGGSRNTFELRGLDDLRRYLPIVPRPIVQTLIGSSDQEYTAGTFKEHSGSVHVIVLKRTLKFGMTNTADTVEDPALVEFCRDAIERTPLRGSNNIQLRVGADGPKIFEINPRFSGTVGIRAHFGFNDVEMAICEALGLVIPKPTIRPGRVLRYMDELYVNRE
jgi:carbamoyl-phosphate synthase large subunit